jgi:hypothetical protein
MEQAVLPPFVSPRMVAWLWVLCGLLVAALAVSGATRVPVYASGIATVVRLPGPAHRPGSAVLAVFLPPDTLPRLHSGQALLLTGAAGAERASERIAFVQPGLVGPVDAQREFDLGAGAARSLIGPSAVALAAEDPPTAYVGSVYPANVVLGTHSALSLLPIVGRWWNE